MRWLIGGLGAILTLALLAVGLLALIPAERIAGLAADRFEERTGRRLTISGPVEARIWPRPGVRAEGIEVANAEWSAEGPLLAATSLDVGLSLSSLLGGGIGIETVRVTGAHLVLERRADGRGNWDVASAGVGPATASGADGDREDRLSIGSVELTGSEVTWVDHAADRRIHLRAIDLSASLDDAEGLARIDGSALIAGQALTLEASVEALGPLLEGSLTPMDVLLEAGETTLRLEGRVDVDPFSLEGRLQARSGDGFELFSAFGLDPPDLPQGLGVGRTVISAAVTLAPEGTLHLRDMVVDLGPNRITGALDIDPAGARPSITGALAAETLDLTAPIDERAPGGSAERTDTGWGRDSLDVSGLFLLDGDIGFSTGRITLDDTTLESLWLRATLRDGRAVVTLQPLTAYGGTVTGDVVVNARGGLSVRANLDLAGLRVQPFLTDFAGVDRLVGVADARLSLLGTGNTEEALMRSLEGTIAFQARSGELLGLDIPGMIRTRDLGYRGEGQKTVFDDLSASFTVTEGTASGDDLSLAAPYLTASGAGDIDLGARRIRYRLIPTLRPGEGESGLTVPILIEGAWSDPQVRPDAEYLARERLEVERGDLAARAIDRLADELDTTPDELDSREAIEEAIKDRIENELLDLLLGR